MLGPRPAAALALVLLLGGCDAAAWYARLGAAAIEELEPADARSWLADPGAALVQVRAGEDGRRLRDAVVVSPDGVPVLPAEVGRVVVVADEAADGFRVAARLARSRDARVGVVTGGVSAWTEQSRRAALPDADRPAGG
jgi:hypothetical protein